MHLKWWTDRWFYYKLVSALLILGMLIVVYLTHMINKTWLRSIDFPFSEVLFQGQFFSFFTFQSNFIIGMWFLIATLYHNKSNKICDNQNIRIAITSYISVTCVTWVFILFPGMIINGFQTGVINILTGIFFHVVSPILMIFYTFKHLQSLTTTIGGYYRKSFLKYWLYPLSYTSFIILRIFLFSEDNFLTHVPIDIIYPYAPPFADELSNVGQTVFIIIAFFIIVHILFIVVNFIILLLIKKITNQRFVKTNNKSA